MSSPQESAVAVGSSSVHAKRKGSLGPGNETRVVKRRAARACVSCRSRKVRCDILVNGECCTNCSLDGLKCILVSSRRGKGDGSNRKSRSSQLDTAALPKDRTAHGKHIQHQATGWTQSVSRGRDQRRVRQGTEGSQEVRARDLPRMAAATVKSRESQRTALTPAPTPLTDDEVPVCLTFDDEDARDTTDACLEQENNYNMQDDTNDVSRNQQQPLESFQMDRWNQDTARSQHQSIYTTHGPATGSTRDFTSDAPTAPSPLIPPFIKPLPRELDPDSLEFLATKGVFNVPDSDLRTELLESYVCSVHTFMPIINLREFTEAVSSCGSTGTVSLLLFQAVMFAGLASLRPGAVRKTGHETIKQARRTYFAKVRLLYDFDTEPEDITVLQSLLLMSNWYDRWDDRKHTWYWTGQALSLAQSMGLHRELQGTGVDNRTYHLRRRLWWSLYIRDRLIALGLRRPMRIRDDESNVPMLTAKDFESGTSGIMSSVCASARAPISQDASQDRVLALTCIDLAKLCVHIGRVLSSQYTILGPRNTLNNSLFVIPRDANDRTGELDMCNEELEAWYKDLHQDVRKVAQDTNTGVAPDPLGIPWSILHMIFLISISVLHRPQILQPCCSSSEESTRAQSTSKQKVKDVARKLTKILHSMLRRDQVHYLPTSGIPASLSAGLGHMLEIKSKDEDIRDVSIFRFYQTMQVLQRLREIYASADSAVHFLATAVRKTGLTVPIQWASQPTPAFMSAGAKAQPLKMMNSSQHDLPEEDPYTLAVTRRLSTNQLQKGSTDDLYARSRPGFGATAYQPPSVLPAQCGPQGAPRHVSGVTQSPEHAANPFHDATNGAAVQSQRAGDATLVDPMAMWGIDDSFFTASSSHDYVVNNHDIASNYDFCSDVFGLLDGMGDNLDGGDTMHVLSRS